MSREWQRALPWVFVGVAALSRWPGLLPPSFSAFYGLAFCAGAFFTGRLRWALPLGTLLVTDLALNLYYQFGRGVDCFTPGAVLYLGLNYAGYAVLILFGRRLGPRAGLPRLLAGGLIGAAIFYLLTNTGAWLLNPFRNPEYTPTIAGWLTALTKGTAGYPPTWEFFRNTLLSGGLFTALFGAALGWSTRPEPAEADEPAPEAAEPEKPAEEARA